MATKPRLLRAQILLSLFFTMSAEAISTDTNDARIPPSFDAPFGSYPNLLGITPDERESFAPVVIFPEIPESDDAGGIAVKDHRQSNDQLATAEDVERKRIEKKNHREQPSWAKAGSLLLQGLNKMTGNLLGNDTEKRKRWNIGKYDENRDGGMYESDLFDDLDNTIDGYGGRRTVHLGIDLGGPVGTPVYAFADGIVHSVGYNPELGDYGYVIVLEHFWGDTNEKNNGKKRCWALYGHLDESTLSKPAVDTDAGCGSNGWKELLTGKRQTALLKPGDFIEKGQMIGRMGDIDENGGWINPHLHFQLSTKAPDQQHDMPGASSVQDRGEALKQYPDPRYVLGPLY